MHNNQATIVSSCLHADPQCEDYPADVWQVIVQLPGGRYRFKFYGKSEADVVQSLESENMILVKNPGGSLICI